MKEPRTYKVMRGTLNFLFRVLFRPVIEGEENIPADGRIILAGNHTHFMDCISVAAATKRCVHFLAKSELMEPPLKFFFAPFGIIPVHRETKDKAALQSAIDVLNDDKVIGIFPEGKVNNETGTLLPLKFGAVKMASVTNSRIVPFIITGKYKIFRKKIHIKFFEPVTVGENLEEANNMLWNLLNDNLQREIKLLDK